MRIIICLLILTGFSNNHLFGQDIHDLLLSQECDPEAYENEWSQAIQQSTNFTFKQLIELENELISSKFGCKDFQSLEGIVKLNIYSLIHSIPELTLDEKLNMANEVERTLKSNQNFSGIDSTNLSTLYNHKAAIHSEKRQYREAEKFANASLDYHPHYCSSLMYGANSLMQFGSFSGLKKSFITCEKFFSEFDNLNGWFSSNKMKLYLSRLHALQGHKDSSTYYLKQVDKDFIQTYEFIFLDYQIEHYNKFEEFQNEETALLRKIEITYPGQSKLINEHIKLAECYINQSKFEKALIHHGEARDSNINKQGVVHDENLQLDIEIQNLKIKLNKLANVSIEECDRINKLILERFNLLNTQKGKLELLGRLSDFYDLLITHSDLIGYTNEEILGLQENSRAFTLFNEIKKNEALKSYLGKENYSMLNGYKNRIQAIDLSISKQNIDDEKKVKLKIEKNTLFEKIDSLKKGFSNYSYDQNRNYSESLESNESIVSYYVLDSSICITIINQDSIYLNRVVFNSEDQVNLEEFKNCISIMDYCSLDESLNRSKQIFDLLFKPFESLIKENIIIVPHGPLNSIPFEALFDSEAYLVERKNISYSYSINLFNRPEVNKRYFNKILAIAPSYNSTIPDYQFDPLTKNSTEVETISKYFYFKTLLKGEASTKSNFLSELNGPNIVHIAGHADIDPEDSDYSFIAFNDSSGEIDSSLLFLSELYAEELNLDMLVLSACNTGIGQYKSGEGILSLTRGFIYAGVHCVISSLWQMEEKKSAQLLDNFYHHLSKGNAKHKALTLAKRDYLEIEGGDYLHPFYWSGFVVIGDCSPMFVRPLFKYLLGIILLLMFFFFIKRRLKQGQNFVSDIT